MHRRNSRKFGDAFGKLRARRRCSQAGRSRSRWRRKRIDEGKAAHGRGAGLQIISIAVEL